MPNVGARTRRWWRAVALVMFFCCCVAALAAVTLDVLVLVNDYAPAVAPGWSGALPGLALAIPGALLLWKRPGHAVPIVLLAAGLLWSLNGLAASWMNVSVNITPELPGTAGAFWLFQRFAGPLVALQLLLIVFPDGALPRGRWRAVALTTILSASLLTLTLTIAPASELSRSDQPLDSRLLPFAQAPVEIELAPGVWAAIIFAARLSIPIGLALGIAVLTHRYRGANEVGRAQVRWLLWGGFTAVSAILCGGLLPQAPADVLVTLAIAAFSTAVLIAITRYHLYDIDSLIGWTLISAILTGGFLVLDAMILALLGISGPAGPVAAISALIIGALYLSLSKRLHRLVRRVVSGRRVEPFEVLMQLTERIEHADSTAEQLDAVAEAVRLAFLSPRVRLILDRSTGKPLALEHGDLSQPLSERFPVQYRGRQLATLALAAPRRPTLSVKDRRLLDALIGHAISAIRLGEAHDELNLARTRLVASREDERAAMSRELHGGIEPLLTDITRQLVTVSARLPQRPSMGETGDPRELVAMATTDVDHAITEVRRIAQGLRPAALAELGLKAAIEQQCLRLSGAGLVIRARLEVPEAMPAAVEVAAYRIASEAVTNVVRHASASQAIVELRAVEDMLLLRVDDDGIGLPKAKPRPVEPESHGLRSQRARAEELGGWWRLEVSPLGGVRVSVRLPLVRA